MICVSLKEKKPKKCLKKLHFIQKNGGRLAEIRLDLTQFSAAETEKVFTLSPIPLIATFKSSGAPDSERLKILRLALDCQAKYIDIDFAEKFEYLFQNLELSEKYHTKTILSYHFRSKTSPKFEEIKEIYEKMNFIYSGLIKIVFPAENENDAEKIKNLYKINSGSIIPLICFCSGKAGAPTRITCLSYGAPFTYASFDENSATAAGQIPFINIKKISEELQ